MLSFVRRRFLHWCKVINIHCQKDILIKIIYQPAIMKTEKIILGIDPGTTIMGFGLIKVVGKKMEFIQMNEFM